MRQGCRIKPTVSHLPIKTPLDLVGIGAYATSIRKSSLFSRLKMDPFIIVDAAMRGQEDMVMNLLNADPSLLLKKAKVKNSVGVEYEVTPLQAAIMANDIQMAEKMKEHFARLTTDLNNEPIDGIAEMQQQIKETYIKSLRRYYEIQQAEIANLIALKSKGQEVDHILFRTKDRYKKYVAAIKSNNVEQIIATHNQAQEDNTFDFQPYIDAILNASDAELDDAIKLIGATAKQTDAARTKLFKDLTLVEKLNRFREKLVEHMQEEIIFNPQHILTGLRHNEKTWDKVDANRIADPNYKKRTVIFSQLVGWAQRCASEPVKQDIRQGTYYLTKQNETRTRLSRFNDVDTQHNIVRNSLVDVSLVNTVSVDGLGYKFAAGEGLLRGPGRAPCGAGGASASSFQNLCRAKTASLLIR